jgi:rhodanese-related sulfurtransferase
LAAKWRKLTWENLERFENTMTLKLFSALFATVLALFLLAMPAWAGGGLIEPDQALQQSNAGEVTIIDVRTPREWAQTGVPSGAKGATIRRDGNQAFLARIKKLTKGDKSAAIAMICATGVRSARATALLRQHGYNNVHDIKGGMFGNAQHQGWLRQNLPAEKCEDC